MSLPKEPRQLMINLMYLVLTAMLALNVTREVLNAFQMLDKSILRSNASINEKNADMYAAFDAAENNPSERDKVKKWNDKAKEIKAETDRIMSFLQGWKDTLIAKSGGYVVIDGVKELKNMEDINTPTEVFLTHKNGVKVKKALEDYVAFVLSKIEDPAVRESMRAQFPLQVVDPPKSEDNPSGNWEYGTFHNIPVVAASAVFSKYQNDIKNSEAMVLEHLMAQVHADDYKFDALTAIAVPKTSYALEGQEIEATIMLAAYNKSANPKITSSAGTVTVEGGVGTLKFRASGVGTRTVNGVITIDKAGKTENYDYSFDYTVGSAGASLQLDKMNVLYIGVDNPITLSASGYNIEDVSVHIPGASLKSTGKGTYNVRMSKQGTVEYTINAKTRTGGTAQVGGGKLRVKYIPAPTASVGGITSGLLKANRAKAQTGVLADLPSFEFDARFRVTSFRFIWIPQGGDGAIESNTGALFNDRIKQLMERSRAGDRWIFEDVKAVGPDGRNQQINSVTITLN